MREIYSEADLVDMLRLEQRTFVLFYESRCPFCIAFLPVFEKYAQSGFDGVFVRVNLDDDLSIREKYSIDVVPTFILFENEKISERLDGTFGVGLDEKQLEDLMMRHRKN
jgi:thiol-disulfide isomerase/thioredoxin